MEEKNRDILLELLHDMEDFAQLKGIGCPAIYLLGGSGCIVGGYINRATIDIDLLDMDYSANIGRLLRLLGPVDVLDRYLTTVADGFVQRAVRLNEFKYLDILVLSKEDILVTKIGRYSEKDTEDIRKLLDFIDIKLLLELIQNVLKRKDISKKVKEAFKGNLLKFKENFHV